MEPFGDKRTSSVNLTTLDFRNQNARAAISARCRTLGSDLSFSDKEWQKSMSCDEKGGRNGPLTASSQFESLRKTLLMSCWSCVISKQHSINYCYHYSHVAQHASGVPKLLTSFQGDRRDNRLHRKSSQDLP